MNHEDDNLGSALRGEVPGAGTDYWSSIDSMLARVETEAEIEAEETSADRDTSDNVVRLRDMDNTAITQLDVNETAPAESWQNRFSIMAAAAVMAVIVGVGLFALNRAPAPETVVAATAADAASLSTPGADTGIVPHANSPLVPLPELGADEGAMVVDAQPPVANRDHWHAVYGVWDCTAQDGAGDWVPAFDSTIDNYGIHSHQDGVIHIHPFFEEYAGPNATIDLFFETMGAELTDETLTLPGGAVLASGTTCDGEPAELHIRKWQFDFLVGTQGPLVFTEDLGQSGFVNDREVWVIALAPVGAELPDPPAERFVMLDQFTGELQDVSGGPGAGALGPAQGQVIVPAGGPEGLAQSSDLPAEVLEAGAVAASVAEGMPRQQMELIQSLRGRSCFVPESDSSLTVLLNTAQGGVIAGVGVDREGSIVTGLDGQLWAPDHMSMTVISDEGPTGQQWKLTDGSRGILAGDERLDRVACGEVAGSGELFGQLGAWRPNMTHQVLVPEVVDEAFDVSFDGQLAVGESHTFVVELGPQHTVSIDMQDLRGGAEVVVVAPGELAPGWVAPFDEAATLVLDGGQATVSNLDEGIYRIVIRPVGGDHEFNDYRMTLVVRP